MLTAICIFTFIYLCVHVCLVHYVLPKLEAKKRAARTEHYHLIRAVLNSTLPTYSKE